jgi:hypothetical protein
MEVLFLTESTEATEPEEKRKDWVLCGPNSSYPTSVFSVPSVWNS